MKRRHFIRATGASIPAISLAAKQADRRIRDDRRSCWNVENDKRINEILSSQEVAENHPRRGGFPNRHRIYHVGTAASFVQYLVAGFVSEESTFHESPKVERALDLAMFFLRRSQHDDGTIDLVSTNFHSTPDTGFVVEPLAVSLGAVHKSCPEKLTIFQEQSMAFLRSAGEPLASGGIHTPNHRWVVCMALSWINHFMPDAKYTRRIGQWLAERIDIDPDGQFTEKSSAGYSPLVDRCLITVARLLGRKQLYEPVRRNLEMTMYYVHANGEIVTEASRRQDQYRIAKMGAYFLPYLYMSQLDDNAQFAAMTRMIEETVGQEKLSNYLIHFIENPRLSGKLPRMKRLCVNYSKEFKHSGLVRIRRNQVDATILANNDTFFTFHKGEAVLQAVRFASAFFGKGQFVAESLDRKDGICAMRQSLTGPYFQPFSPENIPGDGNWHSMPRDKRIQSEVQNLLQIVRVDEEGETGRFAVEFDVRGTDQVPVAIELAFRKGGALDGVRKIEEVPDTFILEKAKGSYRFGNDTIEFGPGLGDHDWTQLRGANPKLDAMSVYITGYSPFKFTLKIS